MIHSDFVHLHLHTQYSLLDGACRIPELMELASRYKMPAIAMTDHGNLFGAIEFYQEAMKAGVKPIIGCEVYVAPESRLIKSGQGIEEAAFHFILLAKDEEGYQNLMRLISMGYLEGFYYRPRIDKEVLARHSKGLIGMTSCLKGEVNHYFLSGDPARSMRAADELKQIFAPGDFYLELMNHRLEDQKKVNAALIEIAKSMNLPLVATNDVHYLTRDTFHAHEILLCIQTGTHLEDPKRMHFETDEFYFKSAQEMHEIFDEIPEAIKNTLRIAEKCNLEFDFKQVHLPHFVPPEGKTKEAHLEELCQQGLKMRYPETNRVILERLNHELAVIKDLGYVGYFLIVHDLVRFAKEKGIPVGPGRGSAAGSLVSYLLGITDLDPLKYDLLFERFLNPNRVSMPDIDIDFCYERRGEVIDYVTGKYGKENVAQIITFGTMAAKAVVRDVGRVMNLPYPDVDRIAKLIPYDINMTLQHALEIEPELRTLYETDPQIKELLDVSMKLEGLCRHASTHAAGVVISEKPLVNYVPLFKTNEDVITTGYPMGSLEKIGLLKMDFLGLKTLTVIDETLKIVHRRRVDQSIVLHAIPLDDPKTYAMLSRGEALGVFQLDSSGMRDLLKRLKPERFGDIVALLALYRPGPIGSGMVDEFIKRKHGQIAIRYDHKALEPILQETYGIILYQEQAIRIANVLAGFELSQADELRRAMSKKNPEVMEAQREAFIHGATRQGVSKRAAEKIFNQIEYFSGYAFNKSHSTAYAMISYQTAYLKANYPVEFMTALLTSEMGNTDKVVLYMEEAKRMGIKILPPDIQSSFAMFTTLDHQTVCFGLAAIKNVGQLAIDSIIEARQRKEFESLYDLCENVDSRVVNRKVLESLIKCGACDSLGLKRAQLMAVLNNALEVAGGIQRDRVRGQFSFFDTFEGKDPFKKSFHQTPDIPEWPEHQLLAFEKELLGFYVTGHPLAKYEREIRMFSNVTSRSLHERQEGEEAAMGGIIHKLKQTMTKKTNERMAILQLEDLEGSIEVLVFPSTFKEVYTSLVPAQAVLVKGRVSLREEQAKLIATQVIPMDQVKSKFTQAIHVHLKKAHQEPTLLQEVQQALARHRGETPVYLHFHLADGQRVQVQANADLAASPTDELIQELEQLIGSGSVILA